MSASGVSVPLANIPYDVLKDVQEIDGSGMDLFVGIGYYFD